MISWKKINESEYEFEIKLFGSIILIGLAIAFYYLLDKALDFLPDIPHLFNAYKTHLLIFLGIFIIIGISTSLTYIRSLGDYEAETQQTFVVARVNVAIWAAFWTAWSIFCAWLTFQTSTLATVLIIIALNTVPGLLAFLFARSVRRDQVKEEQESKTRMGADYYESEPYNLLLERRYHSGYYGLLCIPVYLVSVFAWWIFL